MRGKVNYSVSVSMKYGQEGCGSAAHIVFGASVVIGNGLMLGTVSVPLAEVPVDFWFTATLEESLAHPWAAGYFAAASKELGEKLDAIQRELANV